MESKPIDQSRYDRLFAEPGDWPATIVRKRYIVMSTPRTGSTMLCSALAASGLAGRPVEYLSQVNIRFYRRVRGPCSIGEIWSDYQRRRTSPNGYFGLKMHASQFVDLFGKPLGRSGIAFLRSFDRHILCYRRDKLDQAISYMLASEPDGARADRSQSAATRQFRPEDVHAIRKHIRRLTQDEVFWQSVIARLGLQVHVVEYETLADRTAEVLAGVFAFLDLNIPQGKVPAPTTTKLPNDINQLLRQRYLASSATFPPARSQASALRGQRQHRR